MSVHGVVSERENIAAKMKVLEKEWRERVARSAEVHRSKENVKMHKTKIRRLLEELSTAEEWEGELEAKRRRIEESLMPPVLLFFNKLKKFQVINDNLLQEAYSSGGEEVFKMLEIGANRVRQMERPNLVYFVDLLLRLRHLVNGELELERVYKMAKVVLQELSRPDINWSSLDSWEVEVLKMMTEELEGVPSFMANLIIQLVGRVVKKKSVDIGVQTE